MWRIFFPFVSYSLVQSDAGRARRVLRPPPSENTVSMKVKKTPVSRVCRCSRTTTTTETTRRPRLMAAWINLCLSLSLFLIVCCLFLLLSFKTGPFYIGHYSSDSPTHIKMYPTIYYTETMSTRKRRPVMSLDIMSCCVFSCCWLWNERVIVARHIRIVSLRNTKGRRKTPPPLPKKKG